MTNYSKLNPLFQNQIRLTIMSILINLKEANFTYIKKKSNSTSGNLSIQIRILEKAKYIVVKKEFKNNYPNTICKITDLGIKEFNNYVEVIKTYTINRLNFIKK